MKMSKINWSMVISIAVVGIAVPILLFQWQINASWEKDQMATQENKLTTLGNQIEELNGRLKVISFYLVQSGMPPIYGQPQVENESESLDISISIPINESLVEQMFPVQGKANLSDLDSIYVLSKIQDKYWILTDGISDSTGKWKGVKGCLIPIGDESECEKYEIFAIITRGICGIGNIYNRIPEHLAKSNSIYVKSCSAS